MTGLAPRATLPRKPHARIARAIGIPVGASLFPLRGQSALVVLPIDRLAPAASRRADVNGTAA